jgi:hypothetical protein
MQLPGHWSMCAIYHPTNKTLEGLSDGLLLEIHLIYANKYVDNTSKNCEYWSALATAPAET